MRICVLGDSHTACINHGWQRCKSEFPGIELIFFASRNHGLSGLSLEGQILSTNSEILRRHLEFTSGGLSEVNLPQYDGVFLVGLDFSIPTLSVGYSKSCYDSVCSDVYSRTLSCRIASDIREASKAPVVVMHTPQLAQDLSRVRPIGSLGYTSIIERFTSATCNLSLNFLRQPDSTLDSNWFTRSELSGGSRRLDIGDAKSNHEHPKEDRVHMNVDFGEIMVRNFLALLL